MRAVSVALAAIAVGPTGVGMAAEPPSPTLTLNPLKSPSSNTRPAFKGTATETTTVTIEIYAGATVQGSPVSSATATPSGGKWSSGKASPALSSGEYTAIATQASLGGSPAITSLPVTFRVDTTPPVVTLTFPKSGSSTSSSSQLLQGTASTAEGDKPTVTIKLFAGSALQGEAAQQLTVKATNGVWEATFAGLKPGTYTAEAEQEDGAGSTGKSPSVTFTVTTQPVASAAGPPPGPPLASFKWFPLVPQTGEPVSLVSSSTDATSAITALAWSLASAGSFQGGGPVLVTSFSTPGAHVVRLIVTNAYGLSSLATETISVVGPNVPLMQPFPVVRIAGTETASGVKLRLLAVQQVPEGARITVICKGRGCPIKSASRVAVSSRRGVAPVEFRRFERSLRAGVTLEVRVSKPGEIGKYTRFTVRHRKLPERVDMCLEPDGVKPLVCPSS